MYRILETTLTSWHRVLGKELVIVWIIKTSLHLWNTDIHHCVHKTHHCILSWGWWIQFTASHLVSVRTHFNTTFCILYIFHTHYEELNLSNQNTVCCIWLSLCMLHVLLIHPPCFYHPNNLKLRVCITFSSLCNVLCFFIIPSLSPWSNEPLIL